MTFKKNPDYQGGYEDRDILKQEKLTQFYQNLRPEQKIKFTRCPGDDWYQWEIYCRYRVSKKLERIQEVYSTENNQIILDAVIARRIYETEINIEFLPSNDFDNQDYEIKEPHKTKFVSFLDQNRLQNCVKLSANYGYYSDDLRIVMTQGTRPLKRPIIETLNQAREREERQNNIDKLKKDIQIKRLLDMKNLEELKLEYMGKEKYEKLDPQGWQMPNLKILDVDEGSIDTAMQILDINRDIDRAQKIQLVYTFMHLHSQNPNESPIYYPCQQYVENYLSRLVDWEYCVGELYFTTYSIFEKWWNETSPNYYESHYSPEQFDAFILSKFSETKIKKFAGVVSYITYYHGITLYLITRKIDTQLIKLEYESDYQQRNTPYPIYQEKRTKFQDVYTVNLYDKNMQASSYQLDKKTNTLTKQQDIQLHKQNSKTFKDWVEPIFDH